MRILGIDPGYAIVGYGAVDFDGIRFNTLGYGAITTKSDLPFPERLKAIYDDMITVIEKYNPDKLVYGYNIVEGEEIYYIPNPALGLWINKEKFNN